MSRPKGTYRPNKCGKHQKEIITMIFKSIPFREIARHFKFGYTTFYNYRITSLFNNLTEPQIEALAMCIYDNQLHLNTRIKHKQIVKKKYEIIKRVVGDV